MIERVFLSVLAGLLIQTNAMAFDSSKLRGAGSLALGDILPTLQQAPDLIAQIEALAGKASSEITCWGRRFDYTWKHLAGSRIAPYSCQFADRSLIISTRITLLGKDGIAVADIRAKSEATAVSETITSWKWDPPDTSGWIDPIGSNNGFFVCDSERVPLLVAEAMTIMFDVRKRAKRRYQFIERQRAKLVSARCHRFAQDLPKPDRTRVLSNVCILYSGLINAERAYWLRCAPVLE